MAGAFAQATPYGNQQVLRTLQRLIEFGGDPAAAWLDVGEVMLNRTLERYDQQVDPEGRPWLDLAESTLRRKPAGLPILVLDGFMRDSFSYTADGSGMALGTNKIQAATHQFGDDSRGIPERPFLGVNDEDEERIFEVFQDHLALAMGG
ncbi:MAG: phage virion morphogenesis protein, partial [Proteobacteria bacterium CG1_02_64_396]